MDLSQQLVQAFSAHPLGLCGQVDPARDVGEVEDLGRRLGILALGSVLDINPLPRERWAGLARLETHWLLDSGQVAYRSSREVEEAMEQNGLLGPRHIARVWWQISRGLQGRFQGSWSGLIEANQASARELRDYLRGNRSTFPVLAGPVVSARWLDLVHRIGDFKLKDWDHLRLPITKRQKKFARLVGIGGDEVHPVTSAALHLWSTACQKFPSGGCGFQDCPRR